VKAEQLDAGGLHPEAERRLIHAHEAARIERDEEEVVPALRHALDGRGVVAVDVPLAADAQQVEARRQHQNGCQAEPGKELRAVQCREVE
jgi:trans-aconitate methyltransferase